MSTYTLSQDMERHPLSALFGNIEPEQFAELVDDIRKNGQRDIVAVLDGKVLDGWHRYLACKEAGRDCIGRDFPSTADAISYVESKNLRRRNYSVAQRAAVAVKLRSIRQPGAKEEGCQPGTTSGSSPTVKDLAESAKVSKRSIYRAIKAEKDGTLDDVIEGRAALPGELAPEKPKAPSEEDRLRAVVADLEDRLRVAGTELEWYSARELPETELTQRCQELARQVSTLESRLADEMEKTAALTSKIRYLTKELNRQ